MRDALREALIRAREALGALCEAALQDLLHILDCRGGSVGQCGGLGRLGSGGHSTGEGRGLLRTAQFLLQSLDLLQEWLRWRGRSRHCCAEWGGHRTGVSRFLYLSIFSLNFWWRMCITRSTREEGCAKIQKSAARTRAQHMSPASARLRHAFATAASVLSNEQLQLFERTTSTPVARLVDRVLALSDAALAHVLDVGHRELGNLFLHPLNADGLHVLKWMIARDVVDRRRAANGWTSHARHDEFVQNGLLIHKLKHWHDGARHVPLTLEEADLIALASGWAQRPFGCQANELRTGSALSMSGLAMEGTREHIFNDRDSQYQLHVDVYMPNVKFMVFAEPTSIETGPFHFVLGSHRPTLTKARWLFERTRNLTRPSQQGGGAFRHVNESAEALGQPGGWCHSTRDCLSAAYHWQQRDLADRYGYPLPTPLIVEAGTLIIADTSAFHFRGLGVAGHRRARMGNLVYRCKRLRSQLTTIASVPRLPILTCANGSEASGGCSVLHPRVHAQSAQRSTT